MQHQKTLKRGAGEAKRSNQDASSVGVALPEREKIMLKNYRSQSPLPNIFTEIKKTLTSHGAKQITEDYTGGVMTALSFTIPTNRGDLKFKLPARVDRVEQIFKEQGIRGHEGQAYRTAWATLRDWLAAQMALIDWEMVRIEEVLLPYAVDPSGKTYFEVLESRGFQLGSGKNENK